jgi:hypothetical protein
MGEHLEFPPHDELDGHCYEGCPCLDYVEVSADYPPVPFYMHEGPNVSIRKRDHVVVWFWIAVVLALLIL